MDFLEILSQYATVARILERQMGIIAQCVPEKKRNEP